MTRYRHGKSAAKVYGVWSSMVARCHNPNSRAFKNYGGRGIAVCDRWRLFDNFYADMGDPPTGLTIERRDNNQGYSPDNCVWADRKTQARNQRGKRLITAAGKTATMAEWSAATGLAVSTIWARINKGWSDEDAVLLGKITRRKGIKRGVPLHEYGSRHGVVWSEPAIAAAA